MLLERLQHHASQSPNRVALRAPRGEEYREWTYAQAWQAVLSAAGYLRGLGAAPGQRVAIYAENSPEWVLAYLGVAAAGCAAVPLDAQYTARELTGLLAFADCRVVLTTSTLRPALDAALPSTPVQRVVLIDGASHLFESPPLDPPPTLDPKGLLALIYTSGTTGDPKAVRLSLGAVESNIQDMMRLRMIGTADNLLSLLPLHHCYALTVTVLTPLAIGCCSTFCASLRGPDILRITRETTVTVLPGVPKLLEGFDRALAARLDALPPARRALFRALRAVSRFVRLKTGINLGRVLFRSIRKGFSPRFRFFTSGGAKLDAGIANRFLDLGLTIIEGYGLSETAPVLTFNPLARPKPGSVGRALPSVRLRIESPDTQGVGEIVASGPNLMDGYERRPEDTAAVLKDGWFHTGDLGYLDGDGYLFITGRAKELIVLASGKKVYPEELERHYEKSPIVKEVCIMGEELPDGRVERLCAVVVPDFDELRRRKSTDARVTLNAAFVQMAQSLPSYQRVNEVRIVSAEFPRTRLGKLRRAVIRKMLREQRDNTPAEKPLDAEAEALLASPAAGALLARLRGLTHREGAILPSDHLELDLGLDSLARVELDVIMEREFGVKIPPEQAPDIATVGDLLRRLSGAAPAAAAARGWGEMLRERASPPLREIYDLNRSRLRRNALHAVRHALFRFGQRAFPIDVRGAHLLPRGPFILCPTHASFLDALLVFTALPDRAQERMFFLAYEDLFRNAAMRLVARIGYVVLTATSDTLLPSLRRAIEALDLGWSVTIFPEGVISRDGALQRPRPGAGILSCHSGAPIVPCLIRGSFDTLSYANPRFRLVPLGLTFGAPIRPPQRPSFEAQDYADMAEAWRRAIVEMRRQDDAAGGPTAGRSPTVASAPSQGADA